MIQETELTTGQRDVMSVLNAGGALRVSFHAVVFFAELFDPAAMPLPLPNFEDWEFDMLLGEGLIVETDYNSDCTWYVAPKGEIA